MERYTRKDIAQEGYELEGCGCQGDYMPINDNTPDMIDKLGQIEDIEERIGLSLKTLIDICDNTQRISVEPEKMTMTIWKEKWENVERFVPISFNSSTIYCDVWYGKDFTNYGGSLPLYIDEINKSWWLKKDKSE